MYISIFAITIITVTITITASVLYNDNNIIIVNTDMFWSAAPSSTVSRLQWNSGVPNLSHSSLIVICIKAVTSLYIAMLHARIIHHFETSHLSTIATIFQPIGDRYRQYHQINLEQIYTATLGKGRQFIMLANSTVNWFFSHTANHVNTVHNYNNVQNL